MKPRMTKASSNWPLAGGLGLTLALLLIPAGAASAANYVVRMQGTRFVPREITIAVGDSITWTNLDFSGHDAVSGTNGVPNGFWRTPLFGFGGSATVVFTNITPRSYGYYCTPHVFAGMVGSVTVVPANQPPVVSILEPADGAIVPTGVPLGILADALDDDGRVTRVDFLVDGAFLSSDSLGPFTATYANPTPGNHILRAFAVDDRGATSAPVTVTITALLPPAIVQQPQSTNALELDPVSFSVIATGAPPLALQWQFNGTDIPAATNSTYFIASVRTNDAGSYSVMVSNAVGAVTSVDALLFVTANRLPAVTLVSPTNGQFVARGGSVMLQAQAIDSDGFIQRVQFFEATNLLATVTNAPYVAGLSNLNVGSYRVSARAEDDRGGTATSAEVEIVVLNPPTLSIVSPVEGERYPIGLPVQILYDAVGMIPTSGVEFFANGVSLGDSGIFIPAARDRYELTAIATDIVGQRGTSAPVNIQVYQPEDNPPSIDITNSPANFTRLNSSVVALAGIAQDDVEILRVEAENVTTSDTWVAAGTERWWVEMDLAAGPNTVRVRSIDQAGNASAWVTRYFTYVVPSALTVRTNGLGSVSPNLNGRALEIGKTYRMTARPGRGQIFASWGGAPYQGSILDFVMQSNLVLIANFIPSPFASVSGPYAGLIQETNSYPPDGNGLVTLKVSANGTFTGRLRAAGRNHSFRGVFDHDGFGSAVVLRPSFTPVVLAMQLDLTGETEAIHGSATDGHWVADLVAYRNPYATGTNVSPYSGSRVFLWRKSETGTLTAGTEMKVSSRGKVSLTASFIDGRRVSAGSSISRDARIPVGFSSAKFDSLLGWANVGLTGDPRVSGAGNLIPSGTNGSPATLIIQSLAP